MTNQLILFLKGAPSCWLETFFLIGQIAAQELCVSQISSFLFPKVEALFAQFTAAKLILNHFVV